MYYDIILTTSHNPSPKLRTFIKELNLAIPRSIKITRGKRTLTTLLLEALTYRSKRVIVALERKGNPSGLTVYYVDTNLRKLVRKYTIIFSGVTLWRDIPNATRVYNPESIGVYILSDEENLLYISEKIADSLLAKIVFDEESIKKFDIIVSIDRVNSTFYLKFINPSTRRYCGPIVKIVKVIEYEKTKSKY